MWILLLWQFNHVSQAIGPFDSLEEAIAHAEKIKNGDWFIGKSETEYLFHQMKSPKEVKA
jgi:hypothetical protein